MSTATKVRHTPGEWRICGSRAIEAKAFDGSWKWIADKIRGGSNEEADANASLIAAGPEMLEALEATLKEFDCPARNTNHGYRYAQAVCFSSETRERVRAAIRKAKGEL